MLGAHDVASEWEGVNSGEGGHGGGGKEGSNMVMFGVSGFGRTWATRLKIGILVINFNLR